MLKSEKQVLQDVLEDREQNLIKIRFDLFHAKRKWRQLQSQLVELEKTKMQIQEELNMIKIMVGKSTKSKQREIELAEKLPEIEQEIKEINVYKYDIESTEKLIPLAEGVIESLKECIKDSKKLI